MEWINQLFCCHKWSVCHSNIYRIISNEDKKTVIGSVRLTIYDCDKCHKTKLIPTERVDEFGNKIY